MLSQKKQINHPLIFFTELAFVVGECIGAERYLYEIASELLELHLEAVD